jgi:hypothetical protein
MASVIHLDQTHYIIIYTIAIKPQLNRHSDLKMCLLVSGFHIEGGALGDFPTSSLFVL